PRGAGRAGYEGAGRRRHERGTRRGGGEAEERGAAPRRAGDPLDLRERPQVRTPAPTRFLAAHLRRRAALEAKRRQMEPRRALSLGTGRRTAVSIVSMRNFLILFGTLSLGALVAGAAPAVADETEAAAEEAAEADKPKGRR